MTTSSSISPSDPESMTADERADEIASLLARGLVRAVRDQRGAGDSPATCLDLSGDLSLTVAPRPRGERRA